MIIDIWLSSCKLGEYISLIKVSCKYKTVQTYFNLVIQQIVVFL